MSKLKLGIILAVIFIGLVILSALKPWVIIPSGKAGLVFDWGKIQNQPINDGFHWILPIKQRVELITIQPIQLDHKVPVTSDGAITSDNQTIGADTTIFYKYDPSSIVVMRRDWGEGQVKSLLQSALKESFKEVIGKFDIFKVATSQEEIRNKTWESMSAKVSTYPITLTELRIQNYDWADSFDAQIATTMEKAQKVKQAEQDLIFADKDAQKSVKLAESAANALKTKAEGEKTAAITKAEGEKQAAALMADAKALEGEGIKKYNASVQSNPELEIKFRQLEIEKIRAEKWNGQQVPNNMYGPIPVDTVGGMRM